MTDCEEGAVLRLYHERDVPRGGALDGRDEQECFTTVGKRIGVWLSSEPVEGDLVFSAVVDPSAVQQYEVSAEGADDRIFVVPGAIVSGLGFTSHERRP